jgi:hypothetical protein
MTILLATQEAEMRNITGKQTLCQKKKKKASQKRGGGVTHGVDPEFKLQYQ